ncbi:MaoC family dehydratase N-terminal domain-containing protein [Nonomuraea sp. NPDC050786]|uniref:FAS1-like dehydratase domain-containing protein n=1 Tax=Nonomuraea sp. NPDC050786 TaxID=3154840 RepID=UPI0033D7E665
MSWAPHTVVTTETLDPHPVAALSALFDDGTPAPGPGDALPPLWHWLASARWPLSSALGVDGHPARGSFLPPVELPRRMFAGGEVVFHAPLTVGSTVRRESSVESVTEKSGRSGKLVVVVVATSLYDESGRLAIEERQDLVYRDAGAVAPAAEPAVLDPAGAPLTRAGEWAWDLATDPTLLLRFSAATCNPHRIHYDWPYATRVEGYPGLVVHGPLMTLALAEVLRLEGYAGQVRRMRHRHRKPLFCGRPARLRRVEDAEPLTLGVFGPDPEPHSTLMIDREGTGHG